MLYPCCCSRPSTSPTTAAGCRAARAAGDRSGRSARAASRCVVASRPISVAASVSAGEADPERIDLRVSPCRRATSAGM
eukprot:scaffold11902_cov112-Isochrysis_galbana.AAC.6